MPLANSLVGQLEAQVERRQKGEVRRMKWDTRRKKLLPSESFLIVLKKICLIP